MKQLDVPDEMKVEVDFTDKKSPESGRVFTTLNATIRVPRGLKPVPKISYCLGFHVSIRSFSNSASTQFVSLIISSWSCGLKVMIFLV